MTFVAGRYKSSRRWCRQSSSAPRPWRRRYYCPASRCPRSANTLCAHDRCPRTSYASACNRVLGQDSQILGSPTTQPRSERRLPRESLQYRQQKQPPRHRYGRPVHQHREPRQTNRILQDLAISTEVADPRGDLLFGFFWLRCRQYRRPLRYSIRRGERLILKL